MVFLVLELVINFSFRFRLDRNIVFSPDNSTVRALNAQQPSTWAEHQYIIFSPDNSTVRALNAQQPSTWAEYRYKVGIGHVKLEW